jgi:hypothetical protein
LSLWLHFAALSFTSTIFFPRPEYVWLCGCSLHMQTRTTTAQISRSGKNVAGAFSTADSTSLQTGGTDSGATSAASVGQLKIAICLLTHFPALPLLTHPLSSPPVQVQASAVPGSQGWTAAGSASTSPSNDGKTDNNVRGNGFVRVPRRTTSAP